MNRSLIYLILAIFAVGLVSAECTSLTFSLPTNDIVVGDSLNAMMFAPAYIGSAVNITVLEGGVSSSNVNINPSTFNLTGPLGNQNVALTFNAAGSYTVNAVVSNGTSTCSENATHSGTNSSTITSNVNASEPDLTLNVQTPSQIEVGTTQNINYTIANDGGNATNIAGTYGNTSFTGLDLPTNGSQPYQLPVSPSSTSSNVCGQQSTSLTVTSHNNANSVSQGTVGPVTANYNIVGSDLSIENVYVNPSSVSASSTVNLTAFISNRGDVDAKGFNVVFTSNTGRPITNLSSQNLLANTNATAFTTIGSLQVGETSVRATVTDLSNDCSLSNNNRDTSGTVTVTAAPSTGGSSGSSGGSSGGGSGGRRGDFYNLDFGTSVSQADITVMGQDVIYFTYDSITYTVKVPFVSREQVLLDIDPIDKREYVDMNEAWKVDLNADLISDITITPHSYANRRVTLTFTNLNVKEKTDYSKIAAVGTFLRGLVDKATGDDSDEDSTAKTQGELEVTEEFEEVKDSTVKDTALGVIVMLVIIGGGLGLYFFLRGRY